MNEPEVAMVVPTLNEEDRIEDHLRYHVDHFSLDEVVVVDGGSDDRTVPRARAVDGPARVIRTERSSRGHQLSTGVEETESDWLFFVHVDTRLPDECELSDLVEASYRWGWFDCRLDDERWYYRIISRAISWRSALFSTPTGDQAIWVHRGLLDDVGGIPPSPIMEDVRLVNRLRARESGLRIKSAVRTSARKWRREGPLKVILLMWWFRLRHAVGVSPERIYRDYYGTPAPSASEPS